MVIDKTLIEKLAALEHDQWIAWAENMLATENGLSADRIIRWQQYLVPYDQLSEDVKEHDRVWARKVIEVINNS